MTIQEGCLDFVALGLEDEELAVLELAYQEWQDLEWVAHEWQNKDGLKILRVLPAYQLATRNLVTPLANAEFSKHVMDRDIQESL